LEIAAPERSAADPKAFVRKGEKGGYNLELLIKGAKCVNCLGKIERGVSEIPGIEEARLNLSTGRFIAGWHDTNLEPSVIVQKIIDLGYGAIPFQSDIAQSVSDAEAKKLLIYMTVAGASMMFVMMLVEPVWLAGIFGEMGPGTRTFFHWLAAMIAIPAGAYAGIPFFSSAWKNLKKGHANMDVPISLALILTAALSLWATANFREHTFFEAIVMLEFFLLIGRYLDHKLRQKSRIAAQELLALQAVTANVIQGDGTIKSVKVSEVKEGEIIEILPGDRIPVDGVVIQGISQGDFSLITGETQAIDIGIDSHLRAGSLNLTGKLLMKATKIADDSFLAQIARLVEAGEQSKSVYVRLADKAAQLYVPVVHGAALLTFIGWLIAGRGFETAIWNACAVLIITCPCALGLAVPAVQVVASGRLFKGGVLVKSGDALERLASIDYIVFDKTGVLTRGQPNLINRNEISDENLAAAAMLARASRHPLARAIARLAGPGPSIKDAQEVPGYGVEAEFEGVKIRMGRAEWVGAQSDNSETEMWYRKGDEAPIRFAFSDTLRDDTTATIAKLKKLGLGIEVLSGDKLGAVEAAAKAAGIEKFTAQASPFDKAARLDELNAQGHKTLMVGDGLNDSPALAKALVSIAPGAAADASQSASDMVFSGEHLNSVYESIMVSRMAKSRVIENFWFSAVYNLITVPIAIFGFVTPPIAAFAMSMSSVIVSLNALRLYKK
jgi:Cu2+-exporting ATPase